MTACDTISIRWAVLTSNTDREERIGMMYLTLDDVVQLGLLIVAIIAVVRHKDR